MKLLTSLALLAASVPTAFGQASAGSITGTVSDSSGATVPKAKVDLQNTATGVVISTTTGNDGVYRVANLLVGSYNLSVSASGFTTRSLKDVVIDLNKMTTANVNLEVGTMATAVDVVDSQALIDTTTAQVANNYTSRIAADLPSAANTAGVLNLALLGAGVADWARARALRLVVSGRATTVSTSRAWTTTARM
jgi:hypothetical protein